MENENQKLLFAIEKSAKLASEYKFKQEIPNSPNALKLSKWYANEIEEVTEQINTNEKNCNITCSCSKGCAACCQQLIVVGNVETQAFSLTIENLSTDEKALLKEKVESQCLILQANSITPEIMASPFYNEKQQHEMQKKYFELQMQCPLLNDQNECIIYKQRPTLCWSYRFYGNKEQCSTSYDLSNSIKYFDWEHAVSIRLYEAKRPKRYDLVPIQFALKNLL
jgi:Fe-S-cluster containining protein